MLHKKGRRRVINLLLKLIAKEEKKKNSKEITEKGCCILTKGHHRITKIVLKKSGQLVKIWHNRSNFKPKNPPSLTIVYVAIKSVWSMEGDAQPNVVH